MASTAHKVGYGVHGTLKGGIKPSTHGSTMQMALNSNGIYPNGYRTLVVEDFEKYRIRIATYFRYPDSNSFLVHIHILCAF